MRMRTRIRWQINLESSRLTLVDPEGTRSTPGFFAVDCKNLGISTQEQFRGRSHCRGDVSGFLASIIAFPYLGGGVHGSRPQWLSAVERIDGAMNPDPIWPGWPREPDTSRHP